MSSKKKSSGNDMFAMIAGAFRVGAVVVRAAILYIERWFRHVLNHGRWSINTGPLTHARLCALNTSITGQAPNSFVINTSWVLATIFHVVIFALLVGWSFIRALAH